MIHNFSQKLIHKYKLTIGLFYFYKNFVISEIKEGVILTYNNASELIRLTKTYYNNKIPFVYIANRINLYSFEPTAHFKTNQQFPNVKSYAVVAYDSRGKSCITRKIILKNTYTYL